MVGRTGRGGFVLVLALVVLALAGTMLVAAVGRSSRAALASAEAERELRLRWAQIGLQRLLAPRAEGVLLSAADPKCPWLVELSVTLNDLPVRVIISDEQAKVNLNDVWRRGQRNALEECLRQLQGERGTFATVELDPTESPDGMAPAFGSYDQVFQDAGPALLVGQRSGEPGLADLVTLWGDGSVNIQRAPLAVLRAALTPAMTEEEIHKLEQLRRDRPHLSVEEFFKKMNWSKERTKKLSRLLTDTSRCHGIWILCQDGRTAWTRLHVRRGISVRDLDRPGDPQSQTFVWR